MLLQLYNNLESQTPKVFMVKNPNLHVVLVRIHNIVFTRNGQTLQSIYCRPTRSKAALFRHFVDYPSKRPQTDPNSTVILQKITMMSETMLSLWQLWWW